MIKHGHNQEYIGTDNGFSFNLSAMRLMDGRFVGSNSQHLLATDHI